MVESNCYALNINFITELDNEEEMATPQISQAFTDSPWYANIINALQNLQAPPKLSRTKSRFLKMKSLKFCIMTMLYFGKIMKASFLILFKGRI